MYKVIAEFEDENEVIAKYFIKELENYEEAIEFSKRTFDYLSVSWDFVKAIGSPINDESVSFYNSNDYGQTNGFLSVYLI